MLADSGIPAASSEYELILTVLNRTIDKDYPLEQLEQHEIFKTDFRAKVKKVEMKGIIHIYFSQDWNY